MFSIPMCMRGDSHLNSFVIETLTIVFSKKSQQSDNNQSINRSAIRMSKKLLYWKKSLKKSDKLVKDAAVVPDLPDENDPGNSLERTQSSHLSLAIPPELELSRQLEDVNIDIVRTNDLLAEPNTHSSALSLTNTQQNIFNLSHMNNVQFGNTYHINNNVDERRSKPSDQRTKSIDEMMKSNERINQKVMEVISTHLGQDWPSLFRALGFSNGQIDQMKEDYYINGVKEVIYRLLLDYTQNNVDPHLGTIGYITKLMWKLGFKECVKIMKIHWKNGELKTNVTKDVSNTDACSKGKNID
ncbi:Protein immune deficiency [Pseudolycoriella hygida]|uniref:Protein immune deficiency n=1 Tax=Pseudolycoriella hygida TaxID=35572 RepID=A0A9Q0MZT8_9DIPT|nr:Protein immune deficiency [Pseudolycoriella hygida]